MGNEDDEMSFLEKHAMHPQEIIYNRKNCDKICENVTQPLKEVIIFFNLIKNCEIIKCYKLIKN